MNKDDESVTFSSHQAASALLSCAAQAGMIVANIDTTIVSLEFDPCTYELILTYRNKKTARRESK